MPSRDVHGRDVHGRGAPHAASAGTVGQVVALRTEREKRAKRGTADPA